MDVFNHSFWKLYIKTINDLDPGLNLPEQYQSFNNFENGTMKVSVNKAKLSTVVCELRQRQKRHLDPVYTEWGTPV